MASVAMIAAIVIGEYSAAALVVFMFAIGDWLESLTVARANNALKDLAKLVPATMSVVREDVEIVLPVEDIQTGDIVIVRSGERFGVDGKVRTGTSSVNQSAITGESMPVDKTAGDEVFSGTLNEVGTLEIEVTRIGPGTTLGQIVKLVKDAQQSQAPVQRIANKYARILVPITFGLAILIYLLSGDITRSITVLVVVCPCALVLATPTAVVAAIGNAARRGMLVKSGSVIEQVGKIDIVAFDKTGTLTAGQPVLQKIIPLGDYSPAEILSYAASLERASEHPIGRSIVKAAMDEQVELKKVDEIEVKPGYGITGRLESDFIVIGNRPLFRDLNVLWTDDIDRKAKDLENQGYMIIPVAVNKEVKGLIMMADPPRLEAKKVIAELKSSGIQEVIMITGDNQRTADRVANELGLDRVFAEVLPQDKLKIIRDLQALGKKVAFIGDGVNDAPALAAADVGLAMGLTGTDVAVETADIGLIADEIERIPQIINLSRKTLTVIKHNVIFSMSMNILSVALSGLGIIGPVFGALMHEVSALPVLANSARLINSNPSKKK